MDDEEFQDILDDNHDDWESVTNGVIEEQSRWSVFYSKVFKNKKTGKFFEASWVRGATEQQDGQEESWYFYEVEPKTVEKVIYNAIKDGTKFEGTM